MKHRLNLIYPCNPLDDLLRETDMSIADRILGRTEFGLCIRPIHISFTSSSHKDDLSSRFFMGIYCIPVEGEEKENVVAGAGQDTYIMPPKYVEDYTSDAGEAMCGTYNMALYEHYIQCANEVELCLVYNQVQVLLTAGETHCDIRKSSTKYMYMTLQRGLMSVLQDIQARVAALLPLLEYDPTTV